MLAVVVVVTIVVGTLSILGESRVRGSLAFQMVAGVGQIPTGLVTLTKFSTAAGPFHMIYHMITMADLVLALDTVKNVYGSGWSDRLSGLMRRDS